MNTALLVIDTACRHATTLGFDVTLVSDGHTTIDNDQFRQPHGERQTGERD